MAFCRNCGTNIPEGDAFCPNCGESVEKTVAPQGHPEIEATDRERTKYLAALCYLSFLFGVIGLLAEPNSKFIRFHLNQVLILDIIAIICGVVCIVPVIGWLVGFVGSIAVLVFTIMGIIRACKGEAKELPFTDGRVILHWD